MAENLTAATSGATKRLSGLASGLPNSAPIAPAPKASLAVPQDPRAVVLDTPQSVRYSTQPSIELSRNAKGEPSWTIKASGEKLSELLDEVLAIDRSIRARAFPAKDGASG